MLRSLIALSASALLSAYVVELVLVATQPDDTERVRRAAARAGDHPDRRTVGEVVSDLRGTGIDAQPFFRLINRARDIMPLGNTPGRTIVFCNELGRHMVFRADRHGFNNPDEVWDAPRIDLALIGDSFAQGACEPDGRSFANLLRTDVPALLNLGVGGNEPQLDLATLREYAVPMRVRSAIWFHFAGNDLSGLTAFREHPILGRYSESSFSQGLLHRRSEVERAMVDFYAGHVDEVRRKAEPGGVFSTLDWKRVLRLTSLRGRLGLIVRTEKPVDFQRFSRTVELARIAAAGADLRLAFVIIPAETHVEGGAREPVLERTEEVLRRTGLPVFNLRSAFRREGVDAVFAFGSEGGHLTTRGNEVVAAYVREQVLPALGILP